MIFSRRQILQMLGGAAVAGVLPPLRALADGGRRYLVTGTPDAVCAINLETLEPIFAPADFLAHGFIPNPSDPDLVWGIEKMGMHAAEIDINKGKVTRVLQSPEDTQFYGHGLFWKRENLLLITRVDLKTGQGQLAGYDYASLKQVAEFKATPGGLHDCHLISDDVLMVTSAGLKAGKYKEEDGERVEPSALIEFDLAAGKVLSKKIIADEDQVLGHFTRLDDGTIIALSRPHDAAQHGYIYFAPPHGELKKILIEPALDTKLSSQMLSVAVDKNRHIAIVTNPRSGTLLFMDTRQGKLVGTMEQKGMGMAFDPSLGFLSSSTDLAQIDPVARKARELPLKQTASHALGGGSHSMIIEC